MWAATRLSFTSAVCEPVKSMLKIVAVNVMAVIASFRVNVAVPNDAGLGAPVDNVGVVGGFSWPFVRFANKMTSACPLLLAIRTASGIKKVMWGRSIRSALLA